MIPIVLTAISAITHFWKFGAPAKVVFDEALIGKFIIGYWNHAYFFDIHPPFARLLTTLFGYMLGINDILHEWPELGKAIPDSAVLLRILPVLAGALLPVIVYFICRRLDFSRFISAIASLIICFENSLIAQSRYLVHDNILILFGFLSLWLYLEYRTRKARIFSWPLILSAISVSFSISTKWSGLSFLAVIFVFELYQLYTDTKTFAEVKKAIGKILNFIGIYLLIITTIYSSLFVIHLSILTNTGTGDVYMSQDFQKTLIGNKYFDVNSNNQMSIVSKIIDLNITMFYAQKRVTTYHPSASKWYTWPIMAKPVHYSRPSVNIDFTSHTYYFGNPITYWFGSASILALFMYVICKYTVSRKEKIEAKDKSVLLFILFGYSVNFLPYIFIGRTMFLYHYGSALVFSVLGIVFLLDRLTKNKHNLVYLASFVLTSIIFLVYIYFSPLTYGYHLTEDQAQNRTWMDTWKIESK